MSEKQVSPARTRIVLIIVGILLLGGIAGLIYAHLNVFGGYGRADKDSPDCIPTEATITERTETYGRTKGYHISYEWTVPGHGTFSQEETIDESTWGLLTGDSVEICYMKQDPELATILMNDQGFMNGFIVLLVDFMLLLSLLLVLRLALKERKKRNQTA